MSHVDPAGADASFGRASRRLSGRLSGFSYDAEPCPEARSMDQLKAAAGGGLVGWGVGFLLGASPVGRLLAIGLGAAVGGVAAKWHLRGEWDPEVLQRLFSSRPSGDQPTEA
jgi:hypothetical protein